jgi:uncharacterized protein (TIGR00266 family)
LNIEVHHRPAYALAVVSLDRDESVVAEGGAMVSMDTHVTIQTAAGKKDQGLIGSLFSGLKRMVAGESFFQNTYQSANQAGTVTFAPTHVGDVATYTLGTQCGMILQSKAYLCSAPSVTVDAKWTGAKSFFGGEGLIMLKATGTGPIAFNSFGGIREIEVSGGDWVVDTGHIVAFEDTLSYKVTRFGGGWKSFIFGGEGLVCSFSGSGKLWIQTRNPQAFGQALGPKLPMRES